MAGLISVGESYKDKAMSGFIRESAEQQKIDQANRDLEAQEDQQTMSMVTTGISSAVAIGLMIAAL
jgi:hypothetical protein